MFLNTLNYSAGIPDGLFGNQTKKALQEFQKDNHLTPDGIFGKSTASFVDRNCNSLRRKGEGDGKEEEKIGREENKREEEKEKRDFASQNPAPQTDFNIEKNNKIKNENIEALERWMNDIAKENQSENRELAKILKNTLKNSKGPADAFATAVVALGSGAYSLSNLLWDGFKIALVDLREKEEKLISGKKEKEFYFEIYEKTAQKDKSKNQPTYIIIHGWKSEPSGWVKEIAGVLNDGNSQILLINWKDITGYLNILEDTKYTEDVALKLAENLKNWGIDKDQTTIIGHSMGAMLASRLSYHLGKVKEVVALDTAELLGTGYKFKITQDNKPFPGYSNTALNTKCFAGTASAFGNEDLSEECNEAIKIDFAVSSFEHTGVHKIYRDIIHNNTLYDKILSPWNTDIKITQGEIEVDRNKRMLYLTTEEKDKRIFYGSEVNNEFSCEESVCEFYGWKGNDIFQQENKNFIIKDFRAYREEANKHDSDKLLIKDYYDKEILEDKDNGITYLTLYFKDWFKTHKVDITLEGVKESDVEKWLEITKLKPKTDVVYKNKITKEVYINKIPLSDLGNWIKLNIDQKKTLKKENPIQME